MLYYIILCSVLYHIILYQIILFYIIYIITHKLIYITREVEGQQLTLHSACLIRTADGGTWENRWGVPNRHGGSPTMDGVFHGKYGYFIIMGLYFITI